MINARAPRLMAFARANIRWAWRAAFQTAFQALIVFVCMGIHIAAPAQTYVYEPVIAYYQPSTGQEFSNASAAALDWIEYVDLTEQWVANGDCYPDISYISRWRCPGLLRNYAGIPTNQYDIGVPIGCRTNGDTLAIMNGATMCGRLAQKRVLAESVSFRADACFATDFGGGGSGSDGRSVGNPIIPATGEKVQIEIDITGKGPDALSLSRNFLSRRFLEGDPMIDNAARLGDTWNHNHVARLKVWPALVRVAFGDGKVALFSNVSGAGWGGSGTIDTLVQGTSTWTYTDRADDSAWQFDSAGQLLSKTSRNGWTTSYTYSGDLVTQVANQFGRTLSFTYDGSGRLSGVTASDGQSAAYQYDSSSRLSTVTFADLSTRGYRYEDPNRATALSGVVDERGIRYSTFYQWADKFFLTELAGGVNNYTLTYESSMASVTMTDPLGTARRYDYGRAEGNLAVTVSSSPPANSYFAPIASRVQDTSTGLVTSEVDFLGNVTSFNWDQVRHLLLMRVEASGTPQARTTTFQWTPNWSLPTSVTETGRATAYTYDALGNKLSETVTDTASSVSRTSSWTYNAQGLTATSTMPNGATTQFSYDASGNLGTTTNALGHVTRRGYDSGGRVTSQVDPSGLTTTFAYDSRGRLLSQNAGGLTTTFSYTPTGLTGTATMPAGYVAAYAYDAAQRLTGWQDNRGAQGVYVLDAMGNRTTEQVKDGAGNVIWQLGRSIDSLNRLVTQTLGVSAAQTTSYGYNANADLTSESNGLGQSTSYGLDGLKRITAVTDAAAATARLGYNPLDAVVVASDFKSVTTTFARDALGNATATSTPDAGTRTAQYNALGLPSSVTEALGQASTIAYDLLGRPVQTVHADGKTTTLSYDLAGAAYNAAGSPDASKGFLSLVQDRSGSTAYQRDILGRIVRKTQSLPNGSSQQVSYTFTATGLPGTTTYASGNQLQPAYDGTGQLTALGWNGTPLITGIGWTATGQPGTWTWAFASGGGADIAASRSYDTAGRVAATETSRYAYDAAGRITGLSQQLYSPSDNNPASSGTVLATATWTAGYDATGRITSFIETTPATTTTGPGTATFSHDANGNRLSSQQGTSWGSSTASTSRSYAVTAGTNRLQGYSQGTATPSGTTTASITYSYNANGDITQEGSKTFSFDAEERLRSMATGTTGTSPTTYYTHNALGQRVFKSEAVTGTPTTADPGFAYVYDEAGNLIGEYGTGGPASTGSAEYIWLPTPGAPVPVAAVINGTMFAVHTDHLNTPRRLSNTSGQAVWQWKYSAFGDEQPTIAATRFANTALNPNPGTTTVAPITFNLRYPGQYADVESGLNYNYHRSYDSRSGRYTQPDPIGLDGGWNRFGYVESNPLSLIDPEGLVGIGGDGSVNVNAYPGPPAGGNEHARFGPGGNYHVHIRDSQGTVVRVSTETWNPLTPEDQKKYDNSKQIKKYCESLTDGQKKFFDRVNREVFHKGHPTIKQIEKIGGMRGGYKSSGRGPE